MRVKSVRIWSYSGPHFSRIFTHSISLYSAQMRENAGKMTRITLNTDTFYAVLCVIEKAEKNNFWQLCD